jgi:DNA-binding response OmpR family regulator
MPGEKVLMVDDEAEIRDLVKMHILREGFTFIEAGTGKEAKAKIKQHKPDVILLDIFLPDIDGVELCRQIRQICYTPILFVSCKDSDLDKIIGLTAGGDDYISKPFSPMELVARVKAHLRRLQFPTQEVEIRENSSSISILKSPSIELHPNSYEVFLNDQQIFLSAKEFQLLLFFMQHAQQVFSADHLLQKVWGFQSTIDYKTVIVHIGNLRKKLYVGEDEIITTVRGAGYKFNEKVVSLG